MALIPQPNPSPIDANAAVKSSRIILGALMVGVTTFALVVELALGRKAMNTGISGEVLLAAAGVFTLGGIAASVLVPQTILSGAIKRLAGRPTEEIEPALARSFLASCVLRGALLEGPALFGVVIAMLSGNAAGYIATGLALMVMVLTFPSRGAFDVLMERASGKSMILS